ncbi:LysR family transcriptional regulator [Azospirillum halopraeferens]|uniref:LysR family transcriptional regulator n=1 Tax=Azospirillum halopraeferens TaxID=34010 RepID=UPI000421E6C4|nr:LysR family transcriptional regulator [Azospirillum halopraeferens]
MRSLVSQISIHKLEVLCLVAELGSVSRAAERLGIAQPVVSAHIKALSDKLGAPLTARNGRRVSLTDEGRRVYRWAREMVSRTRELEREMAETHRGVVGKASVGASMTLGSYVLPGLITDFHRRVPKGEISVRVTTPMLATDAVHAGDCDFAFTILDPRHETAGLVVDRIADERLVLVASDRTGLHGGSLRPDELAALPFVTAQSGTPRREIEEAALSRFGVRRSRIVMEFGHAEAIKQAVRAGAGLAFLFRSSVRDELASGALAEIVTAGMELTVPVYQVRRRGKRLSRFQVALMRHLALALRDHPVGN